MEQITLKKDAAQKVETPTSKAKFQIPEIDGTVAKIEEAEQEVEEQEVEEMMGFFAGFFGFLAARRARMAETEEERLAKEMEKIFSRETKRKGCGCGM